MSSMQQFHFHKIAFFLSGFCPRRAQLRPSQLPQSQAREGGPHGAPMMRYSVMPMSACVSACVFAIAAFAAPAEARERSHHRHTLSSKHSHHHSARAHTHSRHAYRKHYRRYARLMEQTYPGYESAPFSARFWQQPGAAPYGVATTPYGAQAPAWTPFGAQAPMYQQQVRQRADRNAIPSTYSSLVSAHAQANGIPEALVHRVVMRESRYNPRAVSRGNYSIMQIRLNTARAMGYTGSAAGLLDANTNMTYAVRYLAGAYRAAGGNHNRAVALYASGYYYQAKRQGFSPYASAMAPSVPAGMTMSRSTSSYAQVAPVAPPVQNFGPTQRYE